MSAPKHWRFYHDRAVKLVACPSCQSPIGSRCTRYDGKPMTGTHFMRRRAARQVAGDGRSNSRIGDMIPTTCVICRTNTALCEYDICEACHRDFPSLLGERCEESFDNSTELES